ncbi:hypothetical protein R1flu_018318 [Riccia fluitans]|uniref:Uncharacterized protein n=1 Tax=Riccia fluitans TaxID=41844 RepID=A0ABD1ZFH2_9MARC
MARLEIKTWSGKPIYQHMRSPHSIASNSQAAETTCPAASPLRRDYLSVVITGVSITSDGISPEIKEDSAAGPSYSWPTTGTLALMDKNGDNHVIPGHYRDLHSSRDRGFCEGSESAIAASKLST